MVITPWGLNNDIAPNELFKQLNEAEEDAQINARN